MQPPVSMPLTGSLADYCVCSATNDVPPRRAAARALVDRGDPRTALFEICDAVVAEAAVKKSFGVAVATSEPESIPAAAEMRSALAELLAAAQAEAVIRADLELSDLLVA